MVWNVIVNTQKNNTDSHQINTQEIEDTKGVIRTVNWRWTDNTMAKRKKDKRTQRSTKHYTEK